MFEQTKQIITDINALSHSSTICNQILQALNLNGFCKYDNLHKVYLFENSNKSVNCSYVLAFLKQSAWYAINPDTHQWYGINTNEITDNHNIALCNDSISNMVLLPTAGPSESNAFETLVRLTLSQNQRNLSNNNQTQLISSNSILTNNNTYNPSQNIVHSHVQSTIILQKFSMVMQELENSQIKCLVTLQKLHRHMLWHKKIWAN